MTRNNNGAETMTTNNNSFCPADYHEMMTELNAKTAEIAKAVKAERNAKAAEPKAAEPKAEAGAVDSLWTLFLG
jgi:membrane protein involved in colicin uptake